MASVVNGQRRRRAGLDRALIPLAQEANANDRRAAQLTCADHAIAGGWEDELGGVLEVLGLRETP